MGEYPHKGRVIHPNSPGTDAPLPRTLPNPAYVSPSGCISVSLFTFLHKLVNVSVSLDSGSHSRKLIEPKEGLVGNSNLRTPWD